MKRQRHAFTLVELLVVIAIIGVLVGLVIGPLAKAREGARVAAMKATVTNLNTALEQFRQDIGDYPTSYPRVGEFGGYSLLPGELAGNNYDYSFIDVGAHRLADAIFGADLLGYSKYENYYIDPVTLAMADKRYGPYLQADQMKVDTMAASESAKKLADNLKPNQFNIAATTGANEPIWYNPNTPVILDTSSNKMTTPVLYYKANKRGRLIHEIYNWTNNFALLEPFSITSAADFDNQINNLNDYAPGTEVDYHNFHSYLWNPATGIGADPQRSPSGRPYNPDTFVIIAAGPDGMYFTEDDITNFSRKD